MIDLCNLCLCCFLTRSLDLLPSAGETLALFDSSPPGCRGRFPSLLLLSHVSPRFSSLFAPFFFGAKLRAPRQAVAPGPAFSDVPAHSAQPVHPRANGPLLHARLEPKDHRHLRSDRDGPR